VTWTARLLAPALRWNGQTGFAHERDTIEQALAVGVGGFCIFGGEVDAVRDLTSELRARSRLPLLISADLERGAGQQFTGATQLPPLAALGYLDELNTTRQAAAITAREALELGVDWILAPVADLDIEPDNPIVGTRSFGADATRVAAHVTAWISGCRAEGAHCCAKHFPGHGRTTSDSHERRPVVPASRADLELDLTPFRAAVIAGADAIMTAHVSFPALDPDGAPATASRLIVRDLLRNELEFNGLVMTDALIMRGILEDGSEQALIAPVNAGCDVLLYPEQVGAAATVLATSLGTALDEAAAREAHDRLGAATAWQPQAEPGDRSIDPQWAVRVAERTIHVVRGDVDVPRAFDLVTVDDDVGGPYPPPSRGTFVAALREAGFDPHIVETIDGSRAAVLAVYADIRAWKGRPGLSTRAETAIRQTIERRPDALVLVFAHARLARLAPGRNVVAAWGGEAVMQSAAALWLAGVATPPNAA